MRSKSQGKILFKLLGAIVALVFIGGGMKERSEITGVQKRGKLATVDPIANYTEFRKKGHSTYTAEFHFKTEDGRDIVQKHSFPKEVLADFNEGRPVQVYYLPHEPTTFVFAKEEPGWWLVIAGVSFLAAALLFA